MEHLDTIAVRAATYVEGHSGNLPACTKLLRETVQQLPPNSRVLEIGFNCGHSAYTMLSARTDVTLLSLDLGAHVYVEEAKRYIDATFPNRHILLLGDSRVTLPQVRGTFDMFFIDGGHDFSVASPDMRNCLRLARAGDLILMDDVIVSPEWQRSWTEGPWRVWSESMAEGAIKHKVVVEFEPGRGVAIGSKA